MQDLIIFVKAPVPGKVKTRLIPALGAAGAARLYKAMARHTMAAARALPDSRIFIAYEAHPRYPDPGWLSKSSAWFSQSRGDLGRRLIHAFNTVFKQSRGSIVVIGSDLPDMTPGLLKKAFRLLDNAPVVVGPAHDGGYYLIGLRQPEPALFKNIPWSSSKVLEATRSALRQRRLAVRLLPLKRDVDRPQDLFLMPS